MRYSNAYDLGLEQWDGRLVQHTDGLCEWCGERKKNGYHRTTLCSRCFFLLERNSYEEGIPNTYLELGAQGMVCFISDVTRTVPTRNSRLEKAYHVSVAYNVLRELSRFCHVSDTDLASAALNSATGEKYNGGLVYNINELLEEVRDTHGISCYICHKVIVYGERLYDHHYTAVNAYLTSDIICNSCGLIYRNACFRFNSSVGAQNNKRWFEDPEITDKCAEIMVLKVLAKLLVLEAKRLTSKSSVSLAPSPGESALSAN